MYTNNSRGRLAVFLLLSAGTFGAVISCQGRHDGQLMQNGQPPTLSANLPPISFDPTVGPTSRETREMGFSFDPAPKTRTGPELKAFAETSSCFACHNNSDSYDMHKVNGSPNEAKVTCVDCHGGYPGVSVPRGIARGDANYENYKHQAHVRKRIPSLWKDSVGRDTAANPQVSGALTNQESADYIRFVNPGDLRAAWVACGACHPSECKKVEKSIMRHGALLWEAALYNNGSMNRREGVYGEFYNTDGTPEGARASTQPSKMPTTNQARQKGVLSALWPLTRWEVTQPGNVLRVFENGAERRPIIGIPDPEERPGAPDVKLSIRGFGTDVRTDPVFISLQKTRLLDPTLNFMGTNDHAGDYRASGCSACHVVYANDRNPVHSTIWSKYGNRGESFSKDTTVNRAGTTQPYSNPWYPGEAREAGHPIQHAFVQNMPTSSCIVCHVHPGTNVSNSYLGFLWWDNESDGKFMYSKHQHDPNSDQEYEVGIHNPEASAARGLWGNIYPNDVSVAGEKAGPNFLDKTGSPDFNAKLEKMQFADFHGHGWVFRAVFKQDRKGNMLDAYGNKVGLPTAEKMRAGINYHWDADHATPPKGVPVHLKDIHLEKGMQCADCHFEQDNHGDGNLYVGTRDAVLVDCVDCHGTQEKPAAMAEYLRLHDDDAKKADTFLDHAFTGNAAYNDQTLGNPAAAGLDKKERDQAVKARRDWARKIIDTHFAYDDGLIQKNKLYSEQRGNAADPAQFDKDAKVSGLNKQWKVVQTLDTESTDSWWVKDNSTDPKAPKLARFAHTVRVDGKTWGNTPSADNKDATHADLRLAHGNETMSCYACHSSWNTSCFGCHLPQHANRRKPMLHNEGQVTRNYSNYNFQTLRDDVYMLGIDCTTRNHKVVPIRSACAVLVSSEDAQRNWIYVQQQTVSAEGFAGTAFSPYFPHTVRSTETKQCTDCHLSDKNDNNAIVSQLLLLGTNSNNFIGRFCYVGEGKGGLDGVPVTERNEPQAVIGSRLHELAYPDDYKKHLAHGKELKFPESTDYHHEGSVFDLQQRGEYLYAACGEDGFIAYDIANIDNKNFSERISTSTLSPLGQRFFVRSKFATSICSPSTLALDPTRPHRKQTVTMPDGSSKTYEPNEEQAVSLLYAFLYMTDREEGLIVIGNPLDDKKNKAGVATLLDGDPENNFLQRAVTFNPGNALRGARHMALYGSLAYVCCDQGLVIVDLADPLHPQIVSGSSVRLSEPRRVTFQFRYAFVTDNEGVKILDITNPKSPVLKATFPMFDARDVYVSRTYAYVAAGREGMVILDVSNPEKPFKYMTYNADGEMNDTTQVKIAMTNASMFAYVADGKNGLKVLQLTSADDRDDTPGYLGYSPEVKPRLIAKFETEGPAIAISKGLDRDRAVDEAGNQLSVFGRRGARPFNKAEQERLYLHTAPDGSKSIYTVTDEPSSEPLAPTAAKADTSSAPTTPEPPRKGPPKRR